MSINIKSIVGAVGGEVAYAVSQGGTAALSMEKLQNPALLAAGSLLAYDNIPQIPHFLTKIAGTVDHRAVRSLYCGLVVFGGLYYMKDVSTTGAAMYGGAAAIGSYLMTMPMATI